MKMTQLSKSPQRKVRFAASHTEIVLESDHLADAQRSPDPSAINERKSGRQKEVMDSKARGYGYLLEGSFENPVFDVQRQLNLFCQLHSAPDTTPRGLERYLSQEHDRERKEARLKCIHDVLAENNTLRLKDGIRVSEKEICYRIAKVSRSASRTSRRFARRFGKADERAVWKRELSESSSKVRKMISTIKIERAEVCPVVRHLFVAKTGTGHPDFESCKASYSEPYRYASLLSDAMFTKAQLQLQQDKQVFIERTYFSPLERGSEVASILSEGDKKQSSFEGSVPTIGEWILNDPEAESFRRCPGIVNGNDDMSDMDDSILFNRKHLDKSNSNSTPGSPAMATVAESEKSHNNGSVTNSRQSTNSASHFISKLAVGSYDMNMTCSAAEATPKVMDDSVASPKFADIRLTEDDKIDCDDYYYDDDSTTVDIQGRNKEDLKLQDDPSTSWEEMSWSCLDLDDSLSLENYSPVLVSRSAKKINQLLKAEQWAMQQPCPLLEGCSPTKIGLRMSDRSRKTKATRTGWESFQGKTSTPGLADCAQSTKTVKKTKKGKMPKFLKRFSSSRSMTTHCGKEEGCTMPATSHTKTARKRSLLACHLSTPGVFLPNEADSQSENFCYSPSELTSSEFTVDTHATMGSTRSLKFWEAAFCSFRKPKMQNQP